MFGEMILGFRVEIFVSVWGIERSEVDFRGVGVRFYRVSNI